MNQYQFIKACPIIKAHERTKKKERSNNLSESQLPQMLHMCMIAKS